MLALSNSLSSYFRPRCSAGIVECSFLRYFIVFQNCFLFPLLMFLVKNDCLEFLNIDVTLSCIPLYLLHNSADPDDFALLNRLFRFRIACFKFFDSQGRFLCLGRVHFGMQLSIMVMQMPSQFLRFTSVVSSNFSQSMSASNSFAFSKSP